MDEVEIKEGIETSVLELGLSELEQSKGSSTHTRRSWMRTCVTIFLSLLIASSASYILGSWLKVSRGWRGWIGVYRRTGPETGPQVFCAGSSLLVSALSWSKVSQALGEGVETWGVGGSSPEIWEVWQQQVPASNITIVGVSVYDLNEMHVAEERAQVVPVSRTIQDLFASDAEPDLSHRILTQYALRYVRLLFPTAGSADRILVGLRSKAAASVGRQTSPAEHEGVVLEPPPPILNAGESSATINDWSDARMLRRIAVLRAENRGRHEFFSGPKHKALERLLLQARRQGRVIVVVLPVSSAYTETFLGDQDKRAFEKAIQQTIAIVPNATLVRLDRLPRISASENFVDLVHMNSLGRHLADEAFLAAVAQRSQLRSNNSQASSAQGN